LEATLICLDNSEWMRNGDYTPSRLEAQNDAVQFVCGAKLQSNAQSSVGVMTYASQRPEVLVNLTADIGKIISSVHSVKLGGRVNFSDGLQIAQLALKHRQNKDQKQRIVVFIGSPIEEEEKTLVNLAKKMKKNNVAVDIVNFGEEVENTPKLEAFIAAINNNDNSHLVTIPPGPHILSDILVSSPIINEEGGPGITAGMGGGAGGFEFGIDPNTDPELALALRISMEEERQRQDRLAAEQAAANADKNKPAAPADVVMQDAQQKTQEQLEEEEMLAQALAMSMAEAMEDIEDQRPISELTEEEQLELAMSSSYQDDSDNQQISDILQQDPNFMSSVLGSLPGVDPNDPRIKSILGGLNEENQGDSNEEKEKKGEKDQEKKD